jgi:hypothetical protein
MKPAFCKLIQIGLDCPPYSTFLSECSLKFDLRSFQVIIQQAEEEEKVRISIRNYFSLRFTVAEHPLFEQLK